MNTALSLFALTALVTVAIPGPTVLLALNNGAQWGLRAALPGIAGAVLSDLVLIGAVAAGLGGLLAASQLGFELLRWVGVGYLGWLAWQLMQSGHVEAASGCEPDRRSAPGVVLRRSFTVALCNPKGCLFFAALLPPFMDAHAPQLPQYLTLALVFTAVDAAVMLAYAALGEAGRRHAVAASRLWVDRVSGAALLALAAALALWRRPTMGA